MITCHLYNTLKRSERGSKERQRNLLNQDILHLQQALFLIDLHALFSSGQ